MKMTSRIATASQFRDRYKQPEYYLTRIKVRQQGAHTFAVSQFGNRLLPRRATYTYANCIAYLVRENQPNSLCACSLVEAKVTRQDRDTYIEVADLQQGYYWLYIDMEWQPDTFKWLNRDLSFSVNCYGVSEVEFSPNMSGHFEHVEILDHVMMAYTIYNLDNDTGLVKMAK